MLIAGINVDVEVIMKEVLVAKKPNEDSVLEASKRERQSRDYAAVRNGQRSSQSMHLFGREIAQKVIVRYKDVDFD
jgi:hypothetical protein